MERDELVIVKITNESIAFLYPLTFKVNLSMCCVNRSSSLSHVKTCNGILQCQINTDDSDTE